MQRLHSAALVQLREKQCPLSGIMPLHPCLMERMPVLDTMVALAAMRVVVMERRIIADEYGENIHP